MSVQATPDPVQSSIPGIPFVEYAASNSPGVYLHWDHFAGIRPSYYRLTRANGLMGEYEPIADVAFPFNDFIDKNGHPRHYYRIQAMDVDGILLTESAPIMGEELLIKASLAYQVKAFLDVPIYDEEVIIGRTRHEGRVAFKNWNTATPPEFRISGGSDGEAFTTLGSRVQDAIKTTVIGEENYPDGLIATTDYQGKIYFEDASGKPTKLDGADRILASYNVRMFTTGEMNQALEMALSSINAQPVALRFNSVSSVPKEWDAALITGATYYLLRQLLVGLNQRERRLLLMDPDNGAYDTVNSLRETTKMYEDEFKEFLKVVPFQRYPRIATNVTPEFSLPGGRSRLFRYAWSGGLQP